MNKLFGNIMLSLRALMRILFLVVILFQLQACTSTPKKLSIRYQASSGLNPDVNHRPSPLVVNIYQLSKQTPLQDLDFFTLYDKAKVVLGDTLLYQDQVEIRPEQSIATEQEYSKKAKFLAVIAAYRDIDNAVWQKVIPLNSKMKKPICVLLGPKEVMIKQGNC